jgi:hypothetical protein
MRRPRLVWRWRLTTAAIGLAVGLSICATAFAAVVQEGNLRISISTRLEPYKLPRTSSASIKAFIAGHVFTADGSTPPQLKRMDIEINKHGHIETEGLPVCGLSQIKATSTEAALAACGEALVGSGHFWASVVFNEEALPYHTTGRLLAFNGVQNGKPVLYIHIYTTQPFPSAFVVTFTIRNIAGASCSDGGPGTEQSKDAGSEGRGAHSFVRDLSRATEDTAGRCVPGSPYGTELSASLPQALGDWGFVNRIKMNIGRDYVFDGRKRGYFEASCPAPAGAGTASFPLALANFSFEETQLSSTVTKSCGVKS